MIEVPALAGGEIVTVRDCKRPRDFDCRFARSPRRRCQHFDVRRFEGRAEAAASDPDTRAALQAFGGLSIKRDRRTIVEVELAIVEGGLVDLILD